MKMTKVPTLMMIASDKLYTRKMNFKTYFIHRIDLYEMYDEPSHTHTHIIFTTTMFLNINTCSIYIKTQQEIMFATN